MDTITTTLASERAALSPWRLRPRCSHLAHWFDTLAVNEFLSPDEQRARQARDLRNLIRHAVSQVAYYRQSFQSLGLTPADLQHPEDLPRLPPLTRWQVHERAADLRATILANDQKPVVVTRSSGTTGQPVQVVQSRSYVTYYLLAKHRELRWFRYDPAAKLAGIRLAGDLPHQRNGQPIGERTTMALDFWPIVGPYFETGPFIGYVVTNPLERQVEWLECHRPNYLISQAADLEHLAFGFQHRPRLDSLRGMEAIGQQLTPGMRRRIEATFGVPVQINYGLNEVGIVAVQCPEGRGYHVHTEHCLVEVVDAAGQPCRAGQTGRILITTLQNPVMPLIRYDADDLAEAVEGPCPCGRTLPSFGAVLGRYRRTAFLPPATNRYWLAILETMECMPTDLSQNLRQYQLHQYRDGSFELRLDAVAALPDAFFERLRQAWQIAGAPEPVPLQMVRVEAIPRGKGGKFQVFTSDHAPPPESDGA